MHGCFQVDVLGDGKNIAQAVQLELVEINIQALLHNLVSLLHALAQHFSVHRPNYRIVQKFFLYFINAIRRIVGRDIVHVVDEMRWVEAQEPLFL